MSDYVVCYLRILTSGYLQSNAEFYQAFIEGGRTIKEYCSQVRKGGRDEGKQSIGRGREEERGVKREREKEGRRREEERERESERERERIV